MIFSGAPFGDLTFSDLVPDAATTVTAPRAPLYINTGNRSPKHAVQVFASQHRLLASGNVTLAAPLGTLTLNGLAATFTQSNANTLAAPLGSLTLNGLLPTFNQSVTLIAPPGTLTLNGLAATFTQSSGTNLVAPLGTLTLNGLVPTISQGNSLTAPLGTLTLNGLLPSSSFTQGNSITSPLGTLTLNGFVPTFDQTGPNVIAAPLGTLTLMGLAPTIVQSGVPSGGGGGTGSGGGGGWRPAGYGKSINLDELDTFQKIKRRMGRGKSLAAALRDIDAVDPVQLTKGRSSSTIAPLEYDEQAELEELELLFNRLHNASL